MSREKVHAQQETYIRVFCNDHDVDEPHYSEYLTRQDTADAWIHLHNLQHHRR